MTIKNWDAFKDSMWDWKVLRGCFGNTKIEPTDIDGFVERNGNFLVIETKLPGVEIKTGQIITFTQLVKDKRFSVLFIWGAPGDPKRLELWRDKSKREYAEADMETLRQVVSNWFNYADANAYGIDY